jgi:transcriptional regulator with XRE-family HTH domain
MFPSGHIFLTFSHLQLKYSRSGTVSVMGENQDTIDRRAAETASAFGSLIRSRRKALNMRQDDLALASGVGRRFLIDLEAGKSSCQLGRCLLVADALGLRVTEFLASTGPASFGAAAGPELPDLLEEIEGSDGQPTPIL